MKRKEIARVIDGAGEFLDNIDGAVAKNVDTQEAIPGTELTHEEIVAMKVALSACSLLIEKDKCLDPQFFAMKLVCLCVDLKKQYLAESYEPGGRQQHKTSEPGGEVDAS